MSPKLRSSSSSSTPSTPIGRSSGVSTPSSTPGRKVPHCRTCGKPRAGHPRSGCKPADASASPEASEGESTEVEDDNITQALGSIRLAAPVSPVFNKDDDTKRAIRARRRSSIQQEQLAAAMTMESLSTESSELIRHMVTDPTLLDKITDDEVDHQEKPHAKIVRWQETLQYIDSPAKAKHERPRSRLMPGTLIPPSPESSFNSQASLAKLESPDPSSSKLSAQRKPQPLARTMSAIEREDFLSFVTSKASTTIYTVPTADLQSISQGASKHKVHAETVVNDDAAEGYLVIGQDETVVKKVADSIAKRDLLQEQQRKLQQREKALEIKEKQLEERKTDPGKGGSALRVAAGGAVVGAVGTWAGLAFA